MNSKREAAFEQYNREQSGDFTDLTSEQIYHAGYDAGVRDSGGEWVAVSQEPTEEGVYFVTVDDDSVGEPSVFEAYWNGAEFVTNDVFRADIGTVVAWRELPEPYNQEKTND